LNTETNNINNSISKHKGLLRGNHQPQTISTP